MLNIFIHLYIHEGAPSVTAIVVGNRSGDLIQNLNESVCVSLGVMALRRYEYVFPSAIS